MAGRQDWRTDPELYRLLDEEFHFTIDLAADDSNHLLPVWLSGPHLPAPQACYCALCSEWGVLARGFLNPPYRDPSAPILRWVQKADVEARKGTTVVMVLVSSTGVEWFKLAAVAAHEIRFLIGRPQHTHPDEPGGNNRADALVLVFRPGPRPLGGAHFCTWEWQRHGNPKSDA